MRAVFAALPELQNLHVGGMNNESSTLDLADLQSPSKITQLKLQHPPKQAELLSTMVNLEHLSLIGFPPGGVPSQLTKLTFLHLNYGRTVDAAGPLQHFSTFTALQEVEVECSMYGTGDMTGDLLGIAHLSKLTRLAFTSSSMNLATMSTYNWTQLTALESLELQGCGVQPAALAAFTQLRALRLSRAKATEGASLQELVAVVSKLVRLTELHASLHGSLPEEEQAEEEQEQEEQEQEEGGGSEDEEEQEEEEEELEEAPAAFTALTASTNLRELHITLFGHTPRKCVLFGPDSVCPHLRLIDLDHECSQWLALSGQHLKLLCSCCPALNSLSLKLCSQASPTDCLSLLQLTSLTNLCVRKLSNGAAAGAVVDAAAQLTGLVQLSLRELPCLTDPRLLQLSALTALTSLSLEGPDFYTSRWDIIIIIIIIIIRKGPLSPHNAIGFLPLAPRPVRAAPSAALTHTPGLLSHGDT
jgi:hypothetical protein